MNRLPFKIDWQELGAERRGLSDRSRPSPSSGSATPAARGSKLSGSKQSEAAAQPVVSTNGN